MSFSRSGGNGPGGATLVTNSSGQAAYAYTGSNVGNDAIQASAPSFAGANGAATVTWHSVVAYPSGDCSGPPIFDGFAGNNYLKLRTGSASGATFLCVALDNGSTHVGGKLTSAGVTSPDNVTRDANHGACDANPASRVLNEEGFVGPFPFDLDINLNPATGDAAWVCVQIVNGVNNTPLVTERIILKGSTPSGTGFAQDSTASFPYVAPPSTGSATAYCQSGTRLVNADVGSAHMWLYTLSESTTRQHVCLRGQQGNTTSGSRLSVDGGGSQTFLTSAAANPATDFGVCDVPIIGLSTPPLLLKAHAGNPSYACVTLLSTSQRITVNGSGSQTVATLTPDS